MIELLRCSNTQINVGLIIIGKIYTKYVDI